MKERKTALRDQKEEMLVFELGGVLEKSGASKRLCTVERCDTHHAEKGQVK